MPPASAAGDWPPMNAGPRFGTVAQAPQATQSRRTALGPAVAPFLEAQMGTPPHGHQVDLHQGATGEP